MLKAKEGEPVGRKYNLSESLSRMQKESLKSQAEFAEELGIPKSTLGTILRTGNTTVYTLLRISENSGVSPNKLLGCDESESAVRGLLEYTDAYSSLPHAKQEKAVSKVVELLELFMCE